MNILDFSTTALETAMVNTIAGAGERKRTVGMGTSQLDPNKPYSVAADTGTLGRAA